MLDVEVWSPASTLAGRFALGVRKMLPPVRERRFWAVQAGILTLAVVHDMVLVALHAHDVAGIPSPLTSGLLLIPVVYAALNFGVRGAIYTSLWASALVVPHWFFVPVLTPLHFWIELSFLVVLNSVALVVGRGVEREHLARLRAEAAVHTAQLAEARYRSLFADHPSAVLLVDEAGRINEANAAASALFGTLVTGRAVEDVLGVSLPSLLVRDRHGTCLELTTGAKGPARLVPTARQLAASDESGLTQVVLTDVTEQHRREEDQRRFAGRLLEVQEDERRRLARELHDDPLQQLTYLARTLDDLGQRADLPSGLAENLGGATDVATEATSSLREIIQGLRPPVLDDLGLVSAVRQLTGAAQRRSGPRVHLELSGSERRLHPDVELAAYRIVQEALTNAIRHSGADSVEVRIEYDAALVLTVQDDGCGVLPPRITDPPARGGLGLLGMRERVNMLGGRLAVCEARPRGTVVCAELPPMTDGPRLALGG